MEVSTVESDKGIGVAMALGAVALVGAGIMFGGGSQLFQAWGFAAAMVASLLGVVAIHAFSQ
ncbi:DUF7525 family protein [Haloferacaceae archaeon DSL9]